MPLIDFELLFTTPNYIVKLIDKNYLLKYRNLLSGCILDIGCGRRPYVKYLKCKSYVGIEQNIGLKPDVVADAVELPFGENSFDSALCTEVIEHLTYPEKCIKEINRVLKREGILYLSAPMCWGLHYEPTDYFRFTKYGLIHLLESNCFNIVAIERRGSLFSLVGARLVDVNFNFCYRLFKPLSYLKLRRLTLFAITIPMNLFFSFMGFLLDGIDSMDTIGWLVIAKCRK